MQKKLEGKSLYEACKKDTDFKKIDGKGSFGVLLEKYYFNYTPNSDPRPDFPEAKPYMLELKSTGLDKYKSGKGFKIKERLALKSLNYTEDYSYTFLDSPLYKKTKNLLLVFYLWEKNTEEHHQKIKLVDTWTIPKEDISFLVEDYNIIIDKIKKGLAHELSGRDTNYLEAATTGRGHNSLTLQPFSDKKASPRRFAFKTSYMNYVLSNILIEKYDKKTQKNFYECIKKYSNLKPIRKSSKSKNLTLNDLLQECFHNYFGKTADKIAATINLRGSHTDKGFYYRLVKKVLTGEEEEIKELVKADIVLKAIRIENDNKPSQNMSSPAFRFIEDIYNLEWEDSDWKKIILKKHLFVFFKVNNDGKYILEKFTLWKMPNQDIEECKKVWLKTKQIITNGEIFKSFNYNQNGSIKLRKDGTPVIKNNFPKKSESCVCHVRPHGSNAKDTYPLPVKDIKQNFEKFTKQSFWLNDRYIGEIYQSIN